MRIFTIIGARPQFIKSVPVSRALCEAGIEEVILHTGQHYDKNMSGIFFEDLEIATPKYNLNITATSHAQMTGEIMIGIEQKLLEEQPDMVVIYGDTNSTLAGVLAASKLQVPVAHIEAGLRSENIKMPEEINRIVADRLSDLLFTPVESAVENLIKEGIQEDRIHCYGDVMYDLFKSIGRSSNAEQMIEELGLKKDGYILATIHRAENVLNHNRLKAIVGALTEVVDKIPVLFPIHPRTSGIIERYNIDTAGILTTSPLGYFEMNGFLSNACLVVTDSGGLQKEAYFAGKGCIVLRTETEWKELVETGWCKICNPEKELDISGFILSNISLKGEDIELYGSGNAAEKIVDEILKWNSIKKCNI